MGNDPVNNIDPSGKVSIKAVYMPVGKIGEQTMAWRLNVKLTTSKMEYAAGKANEYKHLATTSIKEAVKGEAENKIKEALTNTPVGPKGDGANMGSVVELDNKLEGAGLKESLSTLSDISPEQFSETVNSLSPEDKALFESVQGQDAEGMINEAKENYNGSIDEKTETWNIK